MAVKASEKTRTSSFWPIIPFHTVIRCRTTSPVVPMIFWTWKGGNVAHRDSVVEASYLQARTTPGTPMVQRGGDRREDRPRTFPTNCLLVGWVSVMPRKGTFMIATGVDASLKMIERARQRLNYQRQVVARLGFARDHLHAEVVRDMCSAMEAKLDVLLARHAEIVTSSLKPSHLAAD